GFMRFYLTAILLLFSQEMVYSQTEITGRVVDGEAGRPLPSATLLLEGTYRGTITNSEGYFSISAGKLPAVLTVRYIGYESVRIEVRGPADLPVHAELAPSVTEMDEIVVTDRDPGLTIMERVIERKKLWRQGLKTYRAEAYTRQALRNDTSIVSIMESSSIAYWDHERGHREVQLSSRQTSNISEDENFAGVTYLPNFYDDDIEIAGYNMVGITHPDALRFYHFSLIETLQMDGKPLYKIEVTPRRERQPAFEGTAWVLGRDYALIEVDLKPNDVVNFPPPVQEFDLYYRQQFSNYGGEYWLPVDMRVEGMINIGMVGLRFPPMKFSQVSRLSDYNINVTLPDSVYQEEEQITRADSTRWQEEGIEPIPLSGEEQEAYATIDSTKTLEEAFKPEGFLARMMEREENRDDSDRFLGIGRILPAGVGVRGHFNRMDGFHAGLKYDREFSDVNLDLNGFTGYSFHSERWDYGGSFNQRIVDFPSFSIHLVGGYEKITDTRYASKLYTQGMNSFSALLGADDYFDYYRNEKLYGGWRFRDLFPETDLTLTVHRELHGNFEPGSEWNYSLTGWHRDRRANPVIEEGTLHSAKMELGYNVSSTDFGVAGNRQVILSAEVSDEALGSDFHFTKLDLSLDWNFETFYSRRLFTNTLDLHFSGGASFGDLPLQRFGAIDGSLSGFTPFGTLKTRHSRPYEGSRYWLATAEHNFRTIPFELLGLSPLVDKGWGIILFGGAGYTDARGNYPAGLMLTDGIHSEIGVSLNSIFGILRIDVAKRLDSPGTYVGISVPRYF
ncbi:MAG: DUF5686 family protein, partial [Balneolaceae bacterium]